MIRIKHLLEQKKPAEQALTFSNKLAKELADTKQAGWDDETGAINLFKTKVKDIKTYIDLNSGIRAETGYGGIGSFLHSYMRHVHLFKIAEHLSKVLPKNHWFWTVKKVFTWQDVMEELVSRVPGAAGIVPSSSRRPNAQQTLKLLFDQWSKSPNFRKSDFLYKLLTDTNLYGAYVLQLVPDFEKAYQHASIAGSAMTWGLIGNVGAVISSALMIYDAKLYWDEGNKVAAGINAALACIPFIPGILKKLPVFKSLTPTGVSNLSSKLFKFKSIKTTGDISRITAAEMATLTPTEQEIVKQFTQNQKFIYDEVKGPLNIWKTVVQDPKLKAWKTSLTPTEWKQIHQGIMSGKYTYNDIKQMSTLAFTAKGLGIEVALKYSPAELQSINNMCTQVAAAVKGGRSSIEKNIYFKEYYLPNFTVRNQGPWDVKTIKSTTNPKQWHSKMKFEEPHVTQKTIRVHIIPRSQALSMYGKKAANWNGWAEQNGDIYMVLDAFMDKNAQFNQNKFRSTLVHEVAHIKDPSVVRTKSTSKYNRTYRADLDNNENWFKNYYFHDVEQMALRPQAFDQIVIGSDNFANTLGRAKTVKILDNAINYLKTNNKKYYTTELRELLFGVNSGVPNEKVIYLFNSLADKNPKLYSKLVNQVVKQLSKTKSDILRMKGIKEMFIKLKNLL